MRQFTYSIVLLAFHFIHAGFRLSRGVLKSKSFGRVLTQGMMRRPGGLAFLDTVLYVLDHERGLALRFRLSSDVPR
jgi:hypothetical protein